MKITGRNINTSRDQNIGFDKCFYGTKTVKFKMELVYL